MSKYWVPIEIDIKNISKNKEKINEILLGYKPALIIKNFYDPNLCQRVVSKTKNFSNNDEKIFKKIGISLISFVTKKSDYFLQAKKARKTMRDLFLGTEDPRKKIHKVLSEFFPQKEVKIATENGKKYACGVIRIHEEGDSANIHRDCVQFEAPNFEISSFSNQLSAVLYLQQPEVGGELVIYKKIWKKSDEKFREIEFGYSAKVIDNCKEYVKIKPKQGDLIIINPIHFHQILKVRGKKNRITLGLFLAFSKVGQKVVTWS